PGLVVALSTLNGVKKTIIHSLTRATFAMLASSRQWRGTQRTRFQRLLRLDPKLLFVCRGNICRSPFAEEYTRLRLASAGLSSIETLSAGTYPVAKRVPPQLAQNVSLEFGVRLDGHSSRVLERKLTTWAGAIVCMDLRDYRELRSAFPEVKNKLFLLRCFEANTGHLEIPDPWGKSEPDFRQGYTHISSSIEGLIQGLV